MCLPTPSGPLNYCEEKLAKISHQSESEKGFSCECTHGSCVGIEIMNPMNPDIEWQGYNKNEASISRSKYSER